MAIKTIKEVEDETSQIVADLTQQISNYLHTLDVRLDHALLALLTLALSKLKDEVEENGKATIKGILDTPISEILGCLMHDSVLLTFKKQVRETN